MKLRIGLFVTSFVYSCLIRGRGLQLGSSGERPSTIMTSATSFLSSLPERTVRATAALGGGLISETSGILLPPLVRDSRLYQATIGRLLRIVVELVGGVGEVYEADAM